jgi:two-component system chemotaxis sensor kinase CheA
MNDLLDEFLLEARELVAAATANLLALEQKPNDRESLDGAFRAFHTLKGAAGIIDFTAMARALHAAEDVLSELRKGSGAITPELISSCLGCVDQIMEWLDYMTSHGQPPADAGARADEVVRQFSWASAARRGIPEPPPPASVEGAEELSGAAHALLQEQIALLSDVTAEDAPARIASAVTVAVNVLRGTGRHAAAREMEHLLVALQNAADRTAVVSAIENTLRRPHDGTDEGVAAPSPAQDTAPRTLRVDVERIEALVKLAGEISVVKNALGHAVKLAQDSADKSLAGFLADQHTTFERLADELQQSVLQLRVVPMRQSFQRFPRLVRDLAETLGKPIRFLVEGAETEADKTVVENLGEPLLHVLRNAVDHGIEPAARRAAAGKVETGTIRLRARREGEHVIVEVEDDGGGIDIRRVRETAADRGVMASEAVQALSDEDAVSLIFAPGFSTATVVTGLSGRGVGMDAVRRAVERLGGRVGVESRFGKGTCVRFILPFSVIMTRVITVETAGQVFGIPLESVIETVRVPTDRVTPIGAARAFVLRDRTVPLLDLAEILGQRSAPPARDELNVVVAAIGGEVCGLAVERLGERMEVMLKPRTGLLSVMPGISGTSLLGDGRVFLVLALDELLR